MNELPSDVPQIYSVITRTWLSRKPGPWAQAITAFSLLSLVGGCLLYWNNWHGADAWMPGTREAVFTRGEFWRLWTTLFAHADLGHLISNSFLFFILGYVLSGYFGPGVFPLAALFMGGVTNAFSLATYAPQVQLVGASGVVSWMGGAWLTLYSLINTRVSRKGRALRAIGVALMLFAPAEAFDPKISYRTHAIGFGLGVLWAFYYYFRNREKFRADEVREVRVD